MNADTLVADYLGRLKAASWPLPPERREELLAEVAGHIEAALVVAGARDEATVRNVLDRLGPPEVIAATEADAGPADAPGSPTGWAPAPVTGMADRAAWSGFGAIEIIAVLLLTIGSIVLPLVGPLVGLGFAWASPRWLHREKLLATVPVLAANVVYLALLVRLFTL